MAEAARFVCGVFVRVACAHFVGAKVLFTVLLSTVGYGELSALARELNIEAPDQA